MRTEHQKLTALEAVLARHFLRLGRMTNVVMVDGNEIAVEKALLEQDVREALRDEAPQLAAVV